MKFSHVFIDRPIFASVLAIFIMLVGGIAYMRLPVAQFPDIVPPTIVVNASYPGASAQTVADTVATPIEQEINGVEGMIYMYSQSTDDGALSLTVTFDIGTDIDKAQVLVQNRVAIAEPRLPDEVRRNGVDRAQALARPAAGRAPASRPTTPTTRSTSPTTRCSTCATSWRASTASATSRCSACANTRCASGSTPSASRCAA